MATYHTVMRLLENHLSQGYCVYMDNYYSSPTLFADLLTKGTDAVGTCVCDRKYIPKSQLNTLKLKKGESLFLRHKDITATRFYEKQNVYMLSTQHVNDLTPIRRKGASEDLHVPLMVHHYNYQMGGVDLKLETVLCFGLQEYEVVQKSTLAAN